MANKPESLFDRKSLNARRSTKKPTPSPEVRAARRAEKQHLLKIDRVWQRMVTTL
jgi:hypothetical protein